MEVSLWLKKVSIDGSMVVVYCWERQTHWNIAGSLEYLEARSSKSVKYAEGRNAHLLLQRK